MDLFRKCMEPVEKCLRDAKMDKSSVRPLSEFSAVKSHPTSNFGVLERWFQRCLPCAKLEWLVHSFLKSSLVPGKVSWSLKEIRGQG